jgi:hypothetical protein
MGHDWKKEGKKTQKNKQMNNPLFIKQPHLWDLYLAMASYSNSLTIVTKTGGIFVIYLKARKLGNFFFLV